MLITKYILGCLMVIFLGVASAQPAPPMMTAVSASGNIVIHIFLSPCQKPVADHILPEFLEEFKEAKQVVNGKELKACWILENETVFLINENKELGRIPVQAFRPSEVL